MFKKWSGEAEEISVGGNGDSSDNVTSDTAVETEKKAESKPAVTSRPDSPKQSNTILKGSKLIGDINVTSDLEISGDVEGNIKSEQNSNIVLRGKCKGNIETREGSVNIDGSLEGGNITAGKDVTISGKFSGGEVKAKNKIYVNGEFDGKLEANEIEIGSNALGKGELRYKEYISISRGAKIEAQISQTQIELKAVKDTPQKKVVEIKPDKVEPKAENK